MTNFEAWNHANLARLAAELQARCDELLADRAMLLEAWRAEVRASAKTHQIEVDADQKPCLS